MFADDDDYYKVTLWTAVPRLAVKKSLEKLRKIQGVTHTD